MREYDEKDDRNYRIFRVEIDTSNNKYDWSKKITMKRFYAESDETAYQELVEYRKIANKEYKYYVERWSPMIIFRNGKKYEVDESREAFKDEWTLIENIKFFIHHWFYAFPMDIYYWFRDLCYLIKTTHTYSSSWSIDDRVLDVILFNLPILKKHKQCLSWEMLNEAIREKHGKDVDLNKFYETHLQGYGKEIENRAIELEQQMFDKLIEDIKLYRYYMGEYEILDKTDKDLVEFDKKWRHTLPLIKGSYDSYDYKAINNMATKCWNRICTTFMKYGREFND